MELIDEIFSNFFYFYTTVKINKRKDELVEKNKE
jgi:hypothetical protein